MLPCAFVSKQFLGQNLDLLENECIGQTQSYEWFRFDTEAKCNSKVTYCSVEIPYYVMSLSLRFSFLASGRPKQNTL